MSHDDIIDAIEAQDVPAATRRMAMHLGHVEEALRLNEEPKSTVDLRSSLD